MAPGENHGERKGGGHLGPPYLQFAALFYAFRFSVAFRFGVYQSDASGTPSLETNRASVVHIPMCNSRCKGHVPHSSARLVLPLLSLTNQAQSIHSSTI